MIRVDRSTVTPPTIKGKSYRNRSVMTALGKIFLNKCYLCEIWKRNPELFQVDHYVPQSSNVELRTTWDNLYLICGECNTSKNDYSKEILDPCTDDVEDLLVYEIGEDGNMLYVIAKDDTSSTSKNTCELLHRIYMGSISTKYKAASHRDAIRSRAFDLTRSILALMKAKEVKDIKEIQKQEQNIKSILSRNAPYTMFMRSVANDFLKDTSQYFD